ncbi:50s ribosomal protein l2, putative, partial [Perkinsus marinus ATCC 50983]
MSKDSQWATIKLNSTEIKRFPLDCWAVVGQVGNANFWARAKGHCRVKRWLGWRPSVHGVAKNPVEHPHGGGTSHKGPKRNPVSPWGGLVLQKTRSRHKPRTNVISPPSGATTRGV